MSVWIDVKESLPDKDCLAFYKNSHGIGRIVKAFYAREFQYAQDPSEEFQDYNEENDTYYLPSGWYEVVVNWYEYSSIAIHEGVVTHWMPLPEYP